jgi:SAM-dependent methyltransferase
VTQDPNNQYIVTILSQCDINGLDVLEIGCGKGRITRDLVKHAKRVVATDPDAASLTIAQAMIPNGIVTFLQEPTGVPSLPAGSFDVVIYTLSFHHVPEEAMSASLAATANLLKNNGVILVVEPGDGGSFTEAKERFGAGSGDERSAREATIRAMHALEGWEVGQTIPFSVLFQFDNDDDFFTNMLPGYRQQPESFVAEVRQFLDQYRHSDGIILDAGRQLNVLTPSMSNKQP